MDAEPRLGRGLRSCLGWETTLTDVRGRASLRMAALNVSGCKLAHNASVARLPGSGPGAERDGLRSRGWVDPTPSLLIPAVPVPAARAPGPPLMPAMAVTSLLPPRPGRWPGDPRRATAARQHPEVHDAALPPAARARAGAWGARGAGPGPAFLRRCGGRLRRPGPVCGSHPTREDGSRPKSPRSWEGRVGSS